MDISKLSNYFSNERITKYLAACRYDDKKAISLYKYNILVSQCLYPLFSILEVSLRNSIDRSLVSHFSDRSWLLNKRSQFATHPGMIKRVGKIIVPDRFFVTGIERAEKKLYERGISSITHSRLVSELTFGFWIKFFDYNSISILHGAPLKAFRNKPSMKLVLLDVHMRRIVKLRNRISHSEPICFNSSGIFCLDTIRRHETDLLEPIFWIDAELFRWTEKFNSFRTIYSQIRSL
jgi:hypothetical protein